MRASAAALKRKIQARLGSKPLAVLMGGFSAEREISLHSGAKVLQALRRTGLRAFGLDVRRWADLEALRRRAGAAWICLHGTGGEDGQLQGALEWMGLPYTGSGVSASALAMNKSLAKAVLKAHGLPTPPWRLLAGPGDAPGPGLPLPLVVKPNRQGSAVGITIVRRRARLAAAVRAARRLDAEVLLEKYCPGREITVGILGAEALPVIEIVPKNEFYDFQAKYEPGMSAHLLPARIPPALRRRAQALSLDAHRLLGCHGVSRVDLMAGPGGCLHILEVNTIPGMTETSLLPDAARHAGLGFEELVLRIAASAWEPRP